MASTLMSYEFDTDIDLLRYCRSKLQKSHFYDDLTNGDATTTIATIIPTTSSKTTLNSRKGKSVLNPISSRQEEEEKGYFPIDELPNEVLVVIFSYLRFSHKNIAHICKKWHQLYWQNFCFVKGVLPCDWIYRSTLSLVPRRLPFAQLVKDLIIDLITKHERNIRTLIESKREAQQLFYLAISQGWEAEIVQLMLLGDSRLNPLYDDCLAIRIAADEGRTEVMKLFLQDPRVSELLTLEEYQWIGQSIFSTACQRGYAPMLDLVLEEKRLLLDKSSFQMLIRAAARNAHINVVMRLLGHPLILPETKCRIFVWSCGLSDHSVAEHLLVDLKDILTDNLLFEGLKAASYQFCEQILESLSREQLELLFGESLIIQWAVENQRIDYLQLLVTSSGALGQLRDQVVVEVICRMYVGRTGDIEFLKFLIETGEEDPLANYLAIAIELYPKDADISGLISIVRYLLDSPKVTPFPPVPKAGPIAMAVVSGHHEVLRMLLEDPRAHPEEEENIAIACAAELGQLEMVALLLSHPLVDPTAGFNRAISLAYQRKHWAVADLLYADDRVQSSLEAYDRKKQ